jgi:hypothetical protein
MRSFDFADLITDRTPAKVIGALRNPLGVRQPCFLLLPKNCVRYIEGRVTDVTFGDVTISFHHN